MSVIGVELQQELLVLTRGRDFRWSFQNTDSTTKQPTAYPAGDLYFELDTGGQQDAVQQIVIDKANAGTWTATFGGQTTSGLGFDIAAQNPEGVGVDLQNSLEGLSSIGAGNVEVTSLGLHSNWAIDITLASAASEIQQLSFSGTPTAGLGLGGSAFKLACGTDTTTLLAYNCTSDDIQTALQALPSIGSGNVTVTGDFTNGFRIEFGGTKANTDMPQLVCLNTGIQDTSPFLWNLVGGVGSVRTLVPGTPVMSQTLVNTINQTLNSFFDSFEEILGVNITVVVTGNQSAVFTATQTKTFGESDLLTFVDNIVSTAVENALNQIAGLLGALETVAVEFYWTRAFQVEFVGALAQAPQALIAVDGSSLTGFSPTVTATEVQPGVTRFTLWNFTIDGDTASLKVESEVVDTIPNRCHWQLVFQPEGEADGGDPVAAGIVKTQGDDR